MSVVAERVVAPHGWLRYDVERIRSVRHLTDPEHGPDPDSDPGECGFYARRYLELRLSKALSCTNNGVHETRAYGFHGVSGFTRLPGSWAAC
jgi:hypothetical protein